MWMNNVSENAAFDLMPLDQDVSYESYRLPPNSCLRLTEKRNWNMNQSLIKLQNTFVMSNNKEISEALRDETSNCLPT